MTTASTETHYFNLHTTGFGYLNRIRDVQPKGRKGDAFLACSIAALFGASDEPSYCNYDVRVSGADAQHLVRKCIPAVKAGKKVLIGFRIGDGYPEAFTFQSGPRQGEQGLSIKGRLLFVTWIKIDGTLQYKAAPRDDHYHDQSPADQDPLATRTAAAPASSSDTSTRASEHHLPTSDATTTAAPAEATELEEDLVF